MPSSLFGSPARAPQGITASNAAGGIDLQAIQSVKRMMNMYRAAQNPDALEAMAKQSPLISNILKICGPGGLRNSFYQLCREQGVNPDDVLRQLQ